MITINIDLGSAQEVKALVLSDHNMTSAATISLVGLYDTVFTDAVTWADDRIVHFLSAATTKRYWQLQITDAANTDGYIEIGEIYLGSYIELSRNYREGFEDDTDLLMEINETPFGVRRDRYYNTRRNFSYDWVALESADLTKLRALVTAITDRTAGTYKPFWWCPDTASPNDSHLVKIDSLPISHNTLGYYDVSLDMQEVVKSV